MGWYKAALWKNKKTEDSHFRFFPLMGFAVFRFFFTNPFVHLEFGSTGILAVTP